jgi:CheY-like chemotaxis protein
MGLVVDDDVDLRSLAQIILEQSGYQVLVAADGRQALQVAQHDPDLIDLLLTDLVMPGMDGAALGQQLRASHSSPSGGPPQKRGMLSFGRSPAASLRRMRRRMLSWSMAPSG